MTRSGLSACVLLLSWGTCTSAQSPSPDRILPLRGEPLLMQLQSQPTPPSLRDLSLSPDGSKLIYSEQSKDHAKATWLLDIASARRTALAGFQRDQLNGKPQWSADSRQIAFLDQRDGAFALIVWNVASNARPTRIPLPKLDTKGTSSETLVDWAWFSARREVLLVLEAEPAPSVTSPNEMQTSWAWVMSRANARDPRRRVDHQVAAALPRRLVAVDLGAATVRDVPLSIGVQPLRLEHNTDNPSDYPGNNWIFSRDGKQVFVSLRDPKVERIENNYLMWLLRSGDPRGKIFSGAQSMVYALDLASGAVRSRYSAGPGRIARVAQVQGGDDLIVLEADPALATWPMNDQWGYLHRTGSFDRGPPDRAVPLDSKLYGSDRPDVAFLADGSNSSFSVLTIDEITLSTRKRTRLNPPDLPASCCEVSADGTTIAAVLENIHTPPELYVWTRHTRKWRKLTDNAADFRKINLAVGSVEHLSWRSKDDRFDIDGLLVKPEDFDQARRYPLLVLLRGGNATRTARWANRWVDPVNVGKGAGTPSAYIFADAGYLVLMPNHRGTVGGPSVEFSRALVGHYGEHVTLDVEAGVDALIAKGWVDPAKLGILGHSHGSDEVAYAISHSRRYKAAVIVDGAVGLPELYVPAREELESRFSAPWYGRETMTELIGFDPVQQEWADPFKVRTPLLLLWAGYRDEWNAGIENLNRGLTLGPKEPRAQTLKFLYALQGNHVPIDVIIDRDGHEISDIYMLEWQSRLLQWFDFFVQGKGENPIPAMKSPVDYSEALQALRKKSGQR